VTYDDWKTTSPGDDEPDVEACGHRVGTCEGECRAEELALAAGIRSGRRSMVGLVRVLAETREADTEPAPALEEGKAMTPKELLELAERVDGYDPAACVAGVIALRSYARLLRALETVHASGLCGSDVMTPERIVDWANEVQENLGRPGLEEL
jgi:hypothetical protein